MPNPVVRYIISEVENQYLCHVIQPQNGRRKEGDALTVKDIQCTKSTFKCAVSWWEASSTRSNG